MSARTGEGIDELRAALDAGRRAVGSRADATDSSARLHIDRVFTIRGAGTVVTGTLWSGAIGRGDELELLPGRGGGSASAASRCTTSRSIGRRRASAWP